MLPDLRNGRIGRLVGPHGVLGRAAVDGALCCPTAASRPRRTTAPLRCRDNRPMTSFYWVMGVLIVGTFVPSVLYLLLSGTVIFLLRRLARVNAIVVPQEMSTHGEVHA